MYSGKISRFNRFDLLCELFALYWNLLAYIDLDIGVVKWIV